MGAVLCLLLGAGAFAVSVPYVVLGVGPTINTLGTDDGKPIISVTGHSTKPVTGELRLTTVAVSTGRTTVATAVKGWLAHDEVVVPHDSIYPPGQSQQQVQQQNEQDFTTSQDSATAAAACELGYPKGFGIISVQSDSANVAVLRAGDRFVSLNGQPIGSDADLKAVLTTATVGSSVPAVLTRDGAQVTVALKLSAPAAGGTIPRIGVAVGQGCLLPFQVSLALAGIGGPSAGLMFSLGIVDKLGSADLTKGRAIAGTGTIDGDGAVGAIGGISLKMRGAAKAGAKVFLAPADNCSDVTGNVPSGLMVVKVRSLHEAVSALTAIAAGQTAATC